MSEREEIEMLLPWYVSGRLEAAERRKVEAWLARDADLARQLSLIREEDAQTRKRAEAIAVPASMSIERTLAKALGASVAGTVQPRLFARLGGAVRELFVMPGGNLRFAAVAALAAIAVQGVAIGTLLTGRVDESTYQAAGGPAAAASGTFVLLRFVDTASVKTIAELLAAREMTIVEGPKAGGLFRVRIGAASMAASERDARIADLRKQGAVVSIVMPTN